MNTKLVNTKLVNIDELQNDSYKMERFRNFFIYATVYYGTL